MCLGYRLQRVLKLRERGRSNAFHRIHQNSEGVVHPVQPARTQDRVIDQRQQTRLQGQQAAGEVAAVHRRNVDGLQRFQ